MIISLLFMYGLSKNVRITIIHISIDFKGVHEIASLRFRFTICFQRDIIVNRTS